jgi:hypothetical protein
MTKPVINTPMRKAVKRINTENLAAHLEWLGGNASNILRPMEERRKRMQSPALVDNIVAVLRSLPKPRPGPKKIWSAETEGFAMIGLSNGKPVMELARELAAKTGRTVPEVHRQLYRIKQSSQFKRMQQDSRNYRPRKGKGVRINR